MSAAYRDGYCRPMATPILFDTDIGSDIDDAVCLAYLLAQPDCELVGITTVSGQPTMRAALADAVCRASRRDEVAIHAGAELTVNGAVMQPHCPQGSVLSSFEHRSPDE